LSIGQSAVSVVALGSGVDPGENLISVQHLSNSQRSPESFARDREFDTC
jgi:hypothetical protein